MPGIFLTATRFRTRVAVFFYFFSRGKRSKTRKGDFVTFFPKKVTKEGAGMGSALFFLCTFSDFRPNCPTRPTERGGGQTDRNG